MAVDMWSKKEMHAVCGKRRHLQERGISVCERRLIDKS